MKDTSPEIEKKMIEMINRKSPMDRLKMGCSMYDLSKRLVTGALLESNPGITPTRLKRELFLRFYGNDFNSVQRAKVLEHISVNRHA